MNIAPGVRLVPTALLLVACGGGGGGGGPTPPANNAPEMSLPGGLTGSGFRYRFLLPIAGAQSLTFAAADPDGDPLRWEVAFDRSAAASIGLVPPAPASGPTFTLELGATTVAAALQVSVLVSDPRGSGVAIDLLIARTGPPVITGVQPSSALRLQPQAVTVTGQALALGGAVSTEVRFSGIPAPGLTVVDDTQLRCTTPVALAAGSSVVSVVNAQGTSSLPATAFTTYAWPLSFLAADQPLDAGAGSALAMAQDGAAVHAAWLEGGVLVHRASGDGGVTWSAATTLSGGEAPTVPQVAVVGRRVIVAWIGDGASVFVRGSDDDGASFAAAQILDSTIGAPARRLRLAASGSHRYLAWLAGDPATGASRVVTAASDDPDEPFAPSAIVEAGGGNQDALVLLADGAAANVVFTDDRQGAGIVGVYGARTADAGSTWSAARLLSAAGTMADQPRLCGVGSTLHATWLSGGALLYTTSADVGVRWSIPPVELRGTDAGPITEPEIVCDATRLLAAYVAGGTSVCVTQLGANTVARHATVAAATIPAAPRIALGGLYAFVAWSDGDATANAARVLQAVSVDGGRTFGAPGGFGDGTANQLAPALLLDGARLLFAWLDHRGATPALFINRNLP